MIKQVINHKEIIPLWQEAFGDSKEDILFFLENCKHKICLGYFKDDNLIAMLFLIKCSLGYYIYAACTKKKDRKNGAMSALLDYCRKNYTSLCLIPANKTLISYYKNRGFTKEESISSLTFKEIKEICDYLLEGCELDNPFILTNN